MKGLLLTGLVWLLAVSCAAQTGQGLYPINVGLSNGMMDTFTNGVADGWVPYKVNDNAQITFQQDSLNFDIALYSQGIKGIDSTALPASTVTSTGLYRQVNVTPGKAYLYVGYQDIFNSAFAATDYRYIHNFGINTTGGTDPGKPSEGGTIGSAKWLPSGLVFRNKDGGGASTVGGFHRCMSAFTAESGTVTLWTGVSIRTSGVPDSVPTNFNIDSNYLFEFDNTINTTGSLINGGFETFVNLHDGGGGENPDTIPDGWVPCGGGIGSLQHIWTDSNGKRSGNYGVRMWNRYGLNCYGLMQRISTISGTPITFGCYAQGNAYCSASVGIDPTGGTDINSPNVLWTSTQASTWTFISKTTTATGSVATLYLRNLYLADTSQHHLTLFDDATASWSNGADTTPPSAVTVTDSGKYTSSVTDLSAQWTASTDAESGISRYEYGIGTLPGSVDVTGWISNGTSISVVKKGLSLERGKKYFFTVRAVNNASIPGPAASSDGIWCAQVPSTIAEAKSSANGIPVIITNKTISAVFLKDFWITEFNRSSGIRVSGQTSFQPGDTVTVGGLMGVIDGERTLLDTEINPK